MAMGLNGVFGEGYYSIDLQKVDYPCAVRGREGM